MSLNNFILLSSTFKYFTVLSKYFTVLSSISLYFQVLHCTFEVLHCTFTILHCTFKVLWTTFKYFILLCHTSRYFEPLFYFKLLFYFKSAISPLIECMIVVRIYFLYTEKKLAFFSLIIYNVYVTVKLKI